MPGFALLLAASAAPIAGAPLPDVELAQLRGGFALPGGLDISLVVQTDTKLDGGLLLRSVYRVTEGSPVLTIYAPVDGHKGAMATPNSQSATPAAQGNVQVMFDRQNGVSFVATPGGSSPVSLAASGTDGLGEAPGGIASVTPPADGSAIAVPSGNLSVQSLASGTRVRLEADGLDITHLVGNALGSIIANTGSDRAIDTATTVGIDINGATAANLGSAMLRVEAIAIDAAIQMAPR